MSESAECTGINHLQVDNLFLESGYLTQLAYSVVAPPREEEEERGMQMQVGTVNR